MDAIEIAPGAARPQKLQLLAFEAFSLGTTTRLLEPLDARDLDEAIAQTIAAQAWDRGDRIGVREVGERVDRLHIFAVRKAAQGRRVWRDYVPSIEHRRWLEPICTIDLLEVVGMPGNRVGVEVTLFDHHQRKRPRGALYQPREA